MRCLREKDPLPTHKVWAEISKGALVHNFELIRSLVPDPRVRVMPVVKADAYGHGVELCVPLLEEAGADILAVATLEEGLELRALGSRSDILIFGTSPLEALPYLKEKALIQSLVSREEVEAFSQASARLGGDPLKVHIKLDTGMTRLGLSTEADQVEASIRTLLDAFRAPGLELLGVYSHLATADSDPDYLAFQRERFERVLAEAKKQGLPPLTRHLAASSAIAGQEVNHFDLVRPGIVLYGGRAEPREAWGDLRPVMTVKSRIEQVRPIRAGTRVSYGGTWTAPRDAVLAVVNMGYADGLPRLLSNRGAFYHQGRKAPIRGRVCMDRCMVEVTGLPGVQAGDEVMYFGDDGFLRLDAAVPADLLGTIDYEIYTNIHERVPRILVD